MQKSFDTLTGLRGILALWVVFHHVKPQLFYLFGPWAVNVADLGYIAVDFFFVLSGFVLAMTHQQEFAKDFSYRNLKIFYIKRLARIYPLHCGVWCLYLVLPAIYLLSGRGFFWTERFDLNYFFMGLALVNNWGFQDVLSWNVPSWSISTEFASYLLFPFITFLIYRIHSRIISLGIIALICSIVGYLFYCSGATNVGAYIPSMGIWRCIFEFILGMIIFNLFRDGVFDHTEKKYLFSGMLLILAIGIGMSLPDYLWIPLFMVLFISFFIAFENSVQISVPKIFIWLGNISYSVYLTHYFIRDIMKLFLKTEQAGFLWMVTYFIVVLTSSHFIYKFYELPAKRMILAKYGPHKKSSIR